MLHNLIMQDSVEESSSSDKYQPDCAISAGGEQGEHEGLKVSH